MHIAPFLQSRLSRRHWLQCAATASAAAVAGDALAQPSQSGSARDAEGDRPIVVAQIADMSKNQQDISRDFLVGSRTAWQELNARGGVRGRIVQHVSLETDSTPASLQAAWQAAHRQTACVALSGCVGHAAAAGIAALQAASDTTTPLALVAPWLHNAVAESGAGTVFDIFPDYQAQIAHAIKTLAIMGVPQVGVVFANAQAQQQSQAYITQITQAMALKTQILPLPGSTGPAARQLSTPTQAIVLFVGGTPELYEFVSHLALEPGRQCYVVALADVNLQVLAQMGRISKNASIIATQAVPMVTSSLPVVRAYREALGRLFDESPSPHGLAGYIAARYTAAAMAGTAGPITRANLLLTMQRRVDLNIGGFAVTYQGRKRSNAYVTQTMLASDGRIIG